MDDDGTFRPSRLAGCRAVPGSGVPERCRLRHRPLRSNVPRPDGVRPVRPHRGHGSGRRGHGNRNRRRRQRRGGTRRGGRGRCSPCRGHGGRGRRCRRRDWSAPRLGIPGDPAVHGSRVEEHAGVYARGGRPRRRRGRMGVPRDVEHRHDGYCRRQPRLDNPMTHAVSLSGDGLACQGPMCQPTGSVGPRIRRVPDAPVGCGGLSPSRTNRCSCTSGRSGCRRSSTRTASRKACTCASSPRASCRCVPRARPHRRPACSWRPGGGRTP